MTLNFKYRVTAGSILSHISKIRNCESQLKDLVLKHVVLTIESKNKDQLLFSGHEKLKNIIENCSKPTSKSNTKLILKSLFKHIEEYRMVSKKFLDEKSGELMLERLRLIMKDHFIIEAEKRIIENEQINLFSSTFSYAFIGFVRYWILEKNEYYGNIDYAVQKTEEIFNSLMLIAKK